MVCRGRGLTYLGKETESRPSGSEVGARTWEIIYFEIRCAEHICITGETDDITNPSSLSQVLNKSAT